MRDQPRLSSPSHHAGRPRAWGRRCSAFLLLAALGVCPAVATGQTVRGIVVDDLTGDPLAGVLLVLEDASGQLRSRAITPASGIFSFEPEQEGGFVLRTERLGYLPVQSPTLTVAGEQVMDLEVRLQPAPIQSDSLRARGEARDRILEGSGFYERRAMGIGRFITADEIGAEAPQSTTDVLRRDPSVRVLRDFAGDAGIGHVVNFRGYVRGFEGQACLPTLVLDGTIVRRGGSVGGGSQGQRVARLDELITPPEIAAVELYPTGAGVPPRFGGTDARCGVIMVWRKRG